MKHIKKFNEELNPKKAIIGGALAATVLAGCKKDDDLTLSLPKINQTDTSVNKDTESTIDVKDSSKEVDMDKVKLEEPKSLPKSNSKVDKSKKKKILKFKSFFKKKQK
jgi:hypothetical protein